MTKNVGLTFSVGDTTPRFTIDIEQDNYSRIGDTKYHVQCSSQCLGMFLVMIYQDPSIYMSWSLGFFFTDLRYIR